MELTHYPRIESEDDNATTNKRLVDAQTPTASNWMGINLTSVLSPKRHEKKFKSFSKNKNW